MDIAKSAIVKSAAGRDKGKLFFVLDTEGDFLLLADGRRRGVALEAQGFPNAVNQPEFPSTVLRAGEPYHQEIAFAFTHD